MNRITCSSQRVLDITDVFIETSKSINHIEIDNSDIHNRSRKKITEIQRAYKEYIDLLPPLLERQSLENIRFCLIEHCVMGKSITMYLAGMDCISLASKLVRKFIGGNIAIVVNEIKDYGRMRYKGVIDYIHDILYPTNINYNAVDEIFIKDNVTGFQQRTSTHNTFIDFTATMAARLIGFNDAGTLVIGLKNMYTELFGTTTSVDSKATYGEYLNYTPNLNGSVRTIVRLIEFGITQKYGPLESTERINSTDYRPKPEAATADW